MSELLNARHLMAPFVDDNDVTIPLPGVRNRDFSTRTASPPSIVVSAIKFSPTGKNDVIATIHLRMTSSGREWAAATSEGALIYSLDKTVNFDPFRLDEHATPQTVQSLVQVNR